MKHIRLFENFLNEKMGMPAGLQENGDQVFDQVWELILDCIGKSKDTAKVWTKTTGDGYPEGELEVTVRMDVNDNIIRSVVSGSSNPIGMKIADDGTYNGVIIIEVHGNSDDLWSARRDSASTEKLKTDVRSVIYHEMTHMLEEYLRKTTGSKLTSMKDLETLKINIAAGAIDKMRIPKPIADFMFLVYLAQAPEVSARVTETYALLGSVTDPHKRLEILQDSKTWKEAVWMTEYNAEKTIKDTQDILNSMRYAPDWDDLNQALSNTMAKILPQIEEHVGDYLRYSSAAETENSTDTSKILRSLAKDAITSPRFRKTLRNATTNFEKMMREWEGIINRSGEKLKRKLSKIVTA